jgi:hypothetical protein
MNMDIGTDIHLIKSLLTLAGKSEVHLKYLKSISISVKLVEPVKSFINLLHLDQFIQTAQVNEQLETFRSYLFSDSVYVITEILKTNSFCITTSRNADLDAGVKTNYASAGGALDGSHSQDLQERIEYKGRTPLVVAIKACQLFYSESLFRKGVFKLKSGKINVLKNEQLPINFLNTDLYNHGTRII